MNNKSEAEPYDVFSVKNTGGSVIGRVFHPKLETKCYLSKYSLKEVTQIELYGTTEKKVN